jgi:hypothetical protein
VLSAVGRLVRAGTMTPEVALAALDEAAALDQEQIAPTRSHLRRALAMQHNVRVLDGL